MEDSFRIEIAQITGTLKFTVNSLEIKYLFATVEKQMIPS